ncbi:MAG: sensor histidine kinase [Verrucomicrobiota bacterium]
MKKRIIIGLSIYCVVFLLSGLYIIFTIQVGTERLSQLIQLHQVEILREHFLIQVKRVQADLSLRSTRYARRFDTVVKDVMNMKGIVSACFDCHHTPEVQARLRELRAMTNDYEERLSRVLTIRANADRLAVEENSAIEVGEALTDKVRDLIALTSTKLNQRTNRALQEIAGFKRILYVLLGIGPLLSAALAAIFIFGFTKPINELVAGTRALKAGNLDHRVEGLKDEFGELAGAFNEMAMSLKDQMRKIHRAEQMAIVGQLAAGLAHEVKNPMAGIKVAMSVLSGEPYITAEDKEVLGKVIAEITRLETLMKDFLNFAKPQKPRFEPVNLNHVLNTTLAFYLRSHSAKRASGEKIRIDKDFGEVREVQADVSQLQQVFLNLFLNAIDAMPDGGTLGVRTRMENGSVQIDISDTGKGIREDLVDRIFEPFFTTKAKGTGLGLAISRQLVEQHGGTIGASNRPEGGTQFTIELPVAQAIEGGA